MARCDSYYFGECTWGACEYASWVPEGLGNAWQWLMNAQNQGFATSQLPVPGAVVVYGSAAGYSQYGHCGVVIDVGVGDQFLVHEMNFVAWDEYDDRWSNSYDVTGFILPPGVAPPPSPGAPGAGEPAAQDDLIGQWAFLANDWNINLPDRINLLRWLSAAADLL